MNEEEIYTFNEYILGYEKGNNDRSCLTISKIINDDMYVMSSLYDGSADEINMILDNLQQESKRLKEQLQQKEDIIYKIKKCIEEKEEYYGDYMGDGNYTMYSMMGANNNRIPYIKSNLIKQILDNKGE